jgi:hypothetical protein
MKKIFLLLTVFAMVFTSCDPLEDINEAIDAQGNAAIVGDANYTLVDEDYTDEVEDGGLGFSFANFNSEDQAKEEIPAFLSSKYPAWGKGSTVEVTYKLYNKKNDEKSLEVYTVSSQDYTDGGHTFGNFSKSEHITDFLNLKYPSAANRLLVSLTYKYYSGSVTTLNNGFLFNNGTWEKIEGFTGDEYNQMGESYPNFSDEDEALTKIPLFLLDKFKFEGKKAGDIEGIMYKLYVGGGVTESYVVYFIFDGTNWSKYENTINLVLQFGHDGNSWLPDNTIKHSFSAVDYSSVYEGLKDVAGYEDAASNLNQYGNFGRPSSDADLNAMEPSGNSRWNNLMMFRALPIALNKLDPTALDGQKYVVTVSIYNGSAGFESFSLIKESGEWIENK